MCFSDTKIDEMIVVMVLLHLTFITCAPKKLLELGIKLREYLPKSQTIFDFINIQYFSLLKDNHNSTQYIWCVSIYQTQAFYYLGIGLTCLLLFFGKRERTRKMNKLYQNWFCSFVLVPYITNEMT